MPHNRPRDRDLAKQLGIAEDGYAKVLAGVTSLEEVLRVTPQSEQR